MQPGLIYLTHGGLLGEPGRLSSELAEFLQALILTLNPRHALNLKPL